MKTVIISCDEGSRLRPITCTIPKAMLPVMGTPIMEHTFHLLQRHALKDITVVAGYLSEKIKKHISSLNYPEVTIQLTDKSALTDIFSQDDVLIISDSILTDVDLSKLMASFDNQGCAVALSMSDESSDEYGRFYTDENSYATKYIRCPDHIYPTGSIFSGVAIIPKGSIQGEWSGFHPLLEKLTETRRLYVASLPGYIKNISDFESYRKCCRDFMDKKISLPFPCEEKAPSVWVDREATVMQGCMIVPPVYIGKGSFISKGARVESYTQIGENVSVECFSSVKRSIVMNNSVLGENCALRGSIIGQNCSIGFESASYEGSVLGDGTRLGKNSIIKSSVHIWPEKYIEDESVVCENLIWENTSRSSMFENGSASGIINREITPEFSLALGRSAVSVLGKNLAVSGCGSGYSTMIKNSLIAGIQSAGGKAYDLGDQPLPITRSAVRFYSLDGGIALSSYTHEGNIKGSLDIINSLGADIESGDLKALSQLCESGESPRKNGADIVDPEYLFEYKLYYLKQLINSTSSSSLGMKILINCENIWAQNLLASAAKDLECSFTFTNIDEENSFIRKLRENSYDFGVICDYKCETLTIIKSDGKKLSPFDYCALTSLIIMKSFPSAMVFVSDSAPDSIELMAEKYLSTIIRTGINTPFLINKLSESDRKVFLHQFIYRFDAVGALLLLLDFLHSEKITLEELLLEIPLTHTLSTNISCTPHKQNSILKEIAEKYSINSENGKEGVKISFEDGWVLLIPKRIDSAINVISHSFNEEYAREISDILTDEISEK